MNSVRITTTILETKTGFRIQGLEERPGLPAILYDAGDWPLCRKAAEILAEELGVEIAFSHLNMGALVTATHVRPGENP